MKARKQIDYLNEAAAITLWQPWASAVALGLKRSETRGWETSYRGLLLIHAAKRWTSKERLFHRKSSLGISIMLDADNPDAIAYACTPPLGCIVAVADLVECWPTTRPPSVTPNPIPGLTDIERLFGDFAPGRFAWQLENVTRLAEPVRCEGKQGLWYPPTAVIDAPQGE